MKLEYLQLDILEEEAKTLSPYHKIAFAASICERLLPNYYIFARESDWNTSSLLRNALDEVWLLLESKYIYEVKLRQLIIDCEQAIPHDHDNNFSEYVSEARYAAASVCYALELCLEGNSKLVRMVADCAYETLWIYLNWQGEYLDDNWENEASQEQKKQGKWEEKSLEEQEKIIINHPFTVREMTKENEDLQRLKETPILTEEFLQWLRISSNNDGKSLIDLS
ncbi:MULTISPECIES: DUF416 family protein [Nostocales]|uniref:DUF416 family protein n=4 Tax=Nostocales TaxID=1161 RepID=A0A8S9T9D9_9CYAN|nr:DUF416 family protein [Tolypothrix bouteillei]KAF3889181.1 DUF416 family protein [Tolypothrix bouteillei VB521301]